MALQDIVNLSITLKSSSPTKAGFGRALITTSKAPTFQGRTKLYKTADEMLADGFVATDIEYKKAQALKSQQPAPKDFKIGKRLLKPTQIIHLTPTVTTEGFIYSGKIVGPGGTQAFTYTVPAAATLEVIVSALQPLIDAFADVTATEDNTKVVVTSSAAGKILQFTEIVPELKIQDMTADPGIATDLAAIYGADSDWFGLLLDSDSEAEIVSAGTWAESKRRILKAATADFGAKDAATTTDVISDCKALDLFNTEVAYHHEVGSLLAAAAMGAELVRTPGTYTMAHKSFSGVATTGSHGNGTPYLTSDQEAAVHDKNGNTYTVIAGNGDYFPGWVTGGDYVDAVRFIHFMFARIQERVIGVLQGSEVVRYTQAGIDAMANSILSLLLVWTKRPYEALSLEKDLEPRVEFPNYGDIDSGDRQARHLPDGTFSARYTGGIHTMDLAGTVSV
jgi:hypothetical protein